MVAETGSLSGIRNGVSQWYLGLTEGDRLTDRQLQVAGYLSATYLLAPSAGITSGYHHTHVLHGYWGLN